MPDPQTPSPKYQLVKDYVLTKIDNNEIGENDQIPSEAEFAKMLDVSSITVRRALAELVNEGIIYRIKGKGSFVAQPAPTVDTKDSNLVVFILSGLELHDSSYLRIMKGVRSFLSEFNCRLVIEFVENDFEQERELVLQLMDSDIRGLLVYSSDPAAAKGYLDELRRKSIPIVMLDRFPTGYPVSCVTCNNHDGAYEAVEYLISLGHRRIGYAAYDFHLSPEIERYNGYVNAMAEASLPVAPERLYLEKELDYVSLAAQIRSGAITALFCANDRRALDVMENLLAQGIRIPEEFSLMGFDDFESSKFAKVALSTVKQHFEVLGYEAAKLLLDMRSGSSHHYKKIMLPTDLVIRDTVAPPAEECL